MRLIRLACLCTSLVIGLAIGVVAGLARHQQPDSIEVAPIPTPLTPGNTAAIPTILPDRPNEIASSALKQAEFTATLATLDSDACAELVEKWSRPMIISGIGEQRACVRLFRHWTQIDPERAAASLMEMRVSSVGFKRQFVHLAAEGWGAAAANDPEVLAMSLPVLSKSMNRFTRSLALWAIFGGIEAPDFAATVHRARELYGNLPADLKHAKFTDDNEIISVILNQWYAPAGTSAQATNTAKSDPLDIYRFATAEITDPELKWRAQQLAFSQLAELAPEVAALTLEEVGAPESSEQRSELVNKLAVEWVNRDVATAMTWILEHSPEERKGLIAAVIRSSGLNFDSSEMAELVHMIPQSEWTAGTVVKATKQWMRIDPESAISWFSSQPEASDPKAVGNLVATIFFLPMAWSPPSNHCLVKRRG